MYLVLDTLQPEFFCAVVLRKLTPAQLEIKLERENSTHYLWVNWSLFETFGVLLI